MSERITDEQLLEWVERGEPIVAGLLVGYRAQRDSARALLREAWPWICGCDISNDQIADLRARIAKELGKHAP